MDSINKTSKNIKLLKIIKSFVVKVKLTKFKIKQIFLKDKIKPNSII